MTEESFSTTPASLSSDSSSGDQAPVGPTLPFPVVGIGASAGGLGALGTLLQYTPADCGMAFVVILHLSPLHESSAAAILQRHTSMPVLQVTGTVSIELNHVYVIAPSMQLTMQDGHLEAAELNRPLGTHTAIDLFFRTLAEAHRESAFAVVLSGTGSDGTQGLKRVKENGGVTLAQSPSDAEFDGMPLSAIATGMVDITLPVAEMPRKLMDLWANTRRIELPSAVGDDPLAEPPASPLSAAEASERALLRIAELLLERTGHDFRNYKRATILRRIERRLQVNMLPTLPIYADFLETHPGETGPLLQDLLISVTNFFRDRESFDALQQELATTLFAQRPPPAAIRAWAAGCASGEEAYSIAMLLTENALANEQQPALQVFATDIDQKAIALARAGAYPNSIATDVPALRLRRFFNNDHGQLRVQKALRDNVLFAIHNALRDPPFWRLDLVCCRNLLSNLEHDIQQRLLRTFHAALQPNGLLFLGQSETPDAAPDFFTVVDKRHRIYRASPVSSRSRQRPSIGAGLPGTSPLPAQTDPQSRRLFGEIHRQLLEEYAPASAGDARPVDSAAPASYELERMHDELPGSIDESQSSTEQLRAANEELRALNEELRSATEELETSKEELQSFNEELITVNHELKAKVEETAKVNDDLQNLISSTDIATVFVDRAMAIKRYTPRATRVFNIIPSDIGRSLSDLTHKLDYAQLAEDASNTFQSLREIEREVPSIDGKWYLVRMLPYRTTDDRIDGAVINCIDVTERREAENQLRHGEEHMRLVADTTRDYAIITLDHNGRVMSWNVGAEQIFGYTQGEAIGQPISMIFTPEDRLAGTPEAELAQALRDGRAEDDRWHVRKNGGRFFCSGITTPLVGRKSRGFAKIARDLTSARMLEAQREAVLAVEQHVREELQNASRLKDEFLAVMSHELKNPLNLIQLNAELLMRLQAPIEPVQVQRAAGAIRNSVASQAQIVNDLLDLSRLRTGKLALHVTCFDMAPLVARIAQAVHADADSSGKVLRLQSVPQALIEGDSVRVEQIVWNLLSNALKFTPPGGSIDVELAAAEGEVRLTVTDTGRGIEPEFLGKVFEMFIQADSRTTRGEGGLGVGLALVKLLADLHGGRVAVTSDGPGRGACFMVWLPSTRRSPSPPEQPERSRQGVAGLRILLVDDEPETLEAFQLLLSMEGATVEIASSANAALAMAAAGQFDLLVSDVSMPGKDGYDLIAELRASPHGSRLKAIAVTGLARTGDAARALEAGFDEHLPKPLEVAELLAKARRLFGRD